MVPSIQADPFSLTPTPWRIRQARWERGFYHDSASRNRPASVMGAEQVKLRQT